MWTRRVWANPQGVEPSQGDKEVCTVKAMMLHASTVCTGASLGRGEETLLYHQSLSLCDQQSLHHRRKRNHHLSPTTTTADWRRSFGIGTTWAPVVWWWVFEARVESFAKSNPC